MTAAKITLSAISKEHKKLIEDMVTDLDGMVYSATEGFPKQKYDDFQPVKYAIYNLYNEAFDSYQKGEFDREEMLFMLPNLLLFSFAGFAAGLQNDNNREELDELNDDAAMTFARYIGEITDLIKEGCLE